MYETMTSGISDTVDGKLWLPPESGFIPQCQVGFSVTDDSKLWLSPQNGCIKQ